MTGYQADRSVNRSRRKLEQPLLDRHPSRSAARDRPLRRQAGLLGPAKDIARYEMMLAAARRSRGWRSRPSTSRTTGHEPDTNSPVQHVVTNTARSRANSKFAALHQFVHHLRPLPKPLPQLRPNSSRPADAGAGADDPPPCPTAPCAGHSGMTRQRGDRGGRARRWRGGHPCGRARGSCAIRTRPPSSDAFDEARDIDAPRPLIFSRTNMPPLSTGSAPISRQNTNDSQNVPLRHFQRLQNLELDTQQFQGLANHRTSTLKSGRPLLNEVAV